MAKLVTRIPLILSLIIALVVGGYYFLILLLDSDRSIAAVALNNAVKCSTLPSPTLDCPKCLPTIIKSTLPDENPSNDPTSTSSSCALGRLLTNS